uniref:THAP-type domain-containing protein n=1 Tax=Parastrongyloides trichosuri TaxID=131310 RepID=A0A0N4ZAC9_PARTI
MPTTCGFPNCKFRSRYRGQEDNRHFYRIPKRPQVLRQRWLNAIGRTEETVVSQLRICSAHFEGGEKKEGDIPVPDPLVNKPLSIKLPPKESKSFSDKRRRINTMINNNTPNVNHNILTNSPKNNSLDSSNNGILRKSNALKHKGTDFTNFHDYKKRCLNQNESLSRPSSCNLSNKSENFAVTDTNSKDSEFPQNNALSLLNNNSSIFGTQSPSIFGSHSPSNIGQIFPNFKFLQYPYFLANMATTRASLPHRPLVALLDGRDCSVEMPILKEVATVAFCDAQTISEVHAKVFNEAVAALVWQNMKLGREELEKFKSLKVIVRIGTISSNIDVNAASEFGIAVCSMGQDCIEEIADSTLSMILNLYRRTYFIAKYTQETNKALTMEQLKEACFGATKINGSVLGLVGLGRVAIAVVQRAKSFGFKIRYYDPVVPTGLDKALGIEKVETLEELFKTSDCISLHCPMNENTKYLINETSLKIMKKGIFIVNTSSGSLIHERALAEALVKGDVRGAALDCHELEPYDSSSNILSKLPNVINTPNVSWYSSESCKELRIAAANEIKLAVVGRFPADLENCINKNDLVLNSNKTNLTNPANILRRNIQPLPNNFAPTAPISPMHASINNPGGSNFNNINDPLSVVNTFAMTQRVQDQLRNNVATPNVSINAGFRFPNPLMMGINTGVVSNNNINLLMRNGFNNFHNLISGTQQPSSTNSIPNISGTPSPNSTISTVLNSIPTIKKDQIEENIVQEDNKILNKIIKDSSCERTFPIVNTNGTTKNQLLQNNDSTNSCLTVTSEDQTLLTDDNNMDSVLNNQQINEETDTRESICSDLNKDSNENKNCLEGDSTGNKNSKNQPSDTNITDLSNYDDKKISNDNDSSEAPMEMDIKKDDCNWTGGNEENISEYDENFINCDNTNNEDISYTNDSQ